jgi:hypothetical protein
MRRLLQALQDHGQDDEACSIPSGQDCACESRSRTLSKIHYGDGIGQSDCQNRREMRGAEHFNFFSNIGCSKQARRFDLRRLS